MLSKLFISNYALIDKIEINFLPGLSIITGETGAGKSIILGALSTLLGEKAEARTIRNTESKAVIEATFDISDFMLEPFFKTNDIEYFPKECIIRREIAASGRSRAFINDTPVNIATLKELSMQIIDIHSQHSNLLLSKPAYQLSIIDSIAGNRELLADYTSAFHKYANASKEFIQLKESLSKRRSEEDYLRFQLAQFHEIKLSEGEDEVLEAEQSKLSNVTEIKEALWAAENTLDSEELSVLDSLKSVAKNLETAGRHLNEASEIGERINSAIIELRDVAQSISAIQEGLNFDPNELERVTDRLNSIYSLEAKHSAHSVNELLEIQQTMEQAIAEIDTSDELLSQKEKELTQATKEATALAEKLSKSRRKSAQAFIDNLKSVAVTLGMKNLQFDIEFKEVELGPTGFDTVHFLFAFNKQQALMPVENTASGGEISRLMLCIKSIIAQCMNLPTIIFDEVDTGVSGDVAARIGEMMRRIASRLQVIAITHLPQVAVNGQNHYKVFKTDTDNATVTSIKQLNDDERVREIAGMLSGKDIDSAAIENAKSLLKNKG